MLTGSFRPLLHPHMSYEAWAVSQQMCAVLKELFTEAPDALQTLVTTRVSVPPGCNALPGVALGADNKVGFLGVINAALHRIGAPTIAAETEACGSITGFFVVRSDGKPAPHQPATIHDVLIAASVFAAAYNQASAPPTPGGHPEVPEGGTGTVAEEPKPAGDGGLDRGP